MLEIYNKIIMMVLEVIILYTEGKASFLDALKCIDYCTTQDSSVLMDFLFEEEYNNEAFDSNYCKEIESEYSVLLKEIKKTKEKYRNGKITIQEFLATMKYAKYEDYKNIMKEQEEYIKNKINNLRKG